MLEPQIWMYFWKKSSYFWLFYQRSQFPSRYKIKWSGSLQNYGMFPEKNPWRYWALKRGLSRSDASAHSSLGYINTTATAFRLRKWWSSKLIVFANRLRQLLQRDVATGDCGQGSSSFLAPSCATTTYPNTSKALSLNLSLLFLMLFS